MDKENPYQPPQSSLADEARRPSNHGDASKAQRFVNLLIDYVAFLGLSFIVGVATVLFGNNAESASTVPKVLNTLFNLMLMFVYYVGFEALTGRTLGKLITGTKVISSAGGKASILQVFGRTLCRFLPFEPFSFLGSVPGGWHDHLSSTRVVRLRPRSGTKKTEDRPDARPSTGE